MRTLFTILAAAVLLTGCMTPQKATSYLKKRNLLADTCAANFPVKDSIAFRESIKYDTVTLEPENFLDIAKEDTGTAPRSVVKLQRVYVTKTVTKDSIHYVRDQAQEAVLRKQAEEQATAARASLQLYTVELSKVLDREATISKLRRRELYLLLIIAAMLVYTFRKPIGALLNPIAKLYPF